MSQVEPQRWGIVGGGLLGMRLAEQLVEQGHDVTILEAAPQLGGLAMSWQLGDITWDKFYHVILLSDSRTRALIARLGLEDEFRATETKTGFYTDGQLYSLSNSWEFLRFPPLGLLSKFRLGLTILHASRVKDWQSLESIPVEQWLRKWSGSRTTDKIWLPLLRAKLGQAYQEANAAFIWATIARMYAARRSGLKKELFGSIRGGYARIVSRYAEHLERLGVEIRSSARVREITHQAGHPSVVLDEGSSLGFDRVICTAVPPLAAQMLPGLSEPERARLAGIKYQGIVCATVVLKNKLDRFYVTNITDAGIPFTAVIEMTALIDPAEFGGRHLVYLPKYVSSDDPLFTASDEVVQECFLAGLERMYPGFQRSDVLTFQVARVKHVFAIPTLGYSQQVPGIRTSLPGIFHVNSSQIINGTLNVNETLSLAENALPELLNSEPRMTAHASTHCESVAGS